MDVSSEGHNSKWQMLEKDHRSFRVGLKHLYDLQIELDCDRDNFMDPQEAKDYGLIDDVIDVPGIVSPEWVLAEPPKTRINEYWTVRKRKDIQVAPKKDRKRITRQV